MTGRTFRRPELSRAWLLGVWGVGGDVLLTTVLSGMITLLTVSSEESVVVGCSITPGMTGITAVPNWVCSGLSVAASGWSCVVSVDGACVGDRDGCAGMVKVGKDQGTFTTTRMTVRFFMQI